MISVTLSLLISLTTSQLTSPLTNFCRRFAHQTTVIDNKLYIDGGLVDYGGSITSSTVNMTNTYILYADLSSVNADSFPVQHDDLHKPANVPSVQGGALWADQANKLFYLYGGEYNWTTLPPTQFTLWFFDVVYRSWNATAMDVAGEGIEPAAFGGSAVDDNRGVAYYYGGWNSNATSLGFNGDPVMQSDLVVYDMNDNKWRRSVFIDDTPRAEGALFYIPASDKGMLVYFGGVQNESSSSAITGVPMDTIYLFDIGSQQTYSQQTSGGPPGMRRRFCGGVSWAEDRSSYNIYIYGGLPPYGEEGFGFNDVWILSIPSFTWTLWYNESTNAHHSLSCNIINSGQMMLIGGWFPNSTNNACDVPDIWGMHNLNLGMDNVLEVPWYQYLPNLTHYTVPPNITKVIGGSGTGAATLTTPPSGFTNDNLRTYLGRIAPTSSRTATRALPTTTTTSSTPPPNHKPIGKIAGGVLGGLAALTILLLLALFCLRRRKKTLPKTGLPLDNQRAIFTPKHTSTPGTPVPQYQQRFTEDLPQQHYPPPPPPSAPMPYYPPPALPQLYDISPQVSPQYSPMYELPNIRSPPNDAGVMMGYSRSLGHRRTASAQERISEE